MPIAKYGAPQVRREDARLLLGKGAFTDDIKQPGFCHAVFHRSPYAHARIDGIDIEAAKAAPGVVC